jgi:hypothetical protein
MGSLDFSMTWPFHYCPGVNSASNRNEYLGYLLGGRGSQCLGLTTLLHSSANCLDILGTSTSCSPMGLSRAIKGCFTFLIPPHPNNIWWKTKIMKLVICSYIHSHIISSTFSASTLLSTLLWTFGQLAYYVQYAQRKTPLQIHFIHLGNKEIHCIFKICCIIWDLCSTKMPFIS